MTNPDQFLYGDQGHKFVSADLPELVTQNEFQPDLVTVGRYADVILASLRRTDPSGEIVEGVQLGDSIIVSFPMEANALGAMLITKIQEQGAVFFTHQNILELNAELATLFSAQDLANFSLVYIQALVKISHHFIDIAAIRGYQGVGQEVIEYEASSGANMRKTVIDATTDPSGLLNSRVKIYWPTQELADQNETTLEILWENLIAALYLDDEDPLARMAESDRAVKENTARLNQLEIRHITVSSDSGDTQLSFSLAPDSCWVGASGANRPSFESFTAVDRNSANGWITYDVPVKLGSHTFTKLKIFYESGKAVSVEGPSGSIHDAESREFMELIEKYPNFDRLGEFALTPKKLSRLKKGFGVVLWTENLPGLHFAHGASYPKNYAGDKSKAMSDAEWEELGYNRCDIHFDLVRMGNFTVQATLKNGETQKIFENGDFCF